VCCFVLLNRYWGIVTVPGFLHERAKGYAPTIENRRREKDKKLFSVNFSLHILSILLHLLRIIRILLHFKQLSYKNQSTLTIGKLAVVEKSCRCRKEKARTGWSNVDRGPLKIGCKSYSLDQSDSEQHNALR